MPFRAFFVESPRETRAREATAKKSRHDDEDKNDTQWAKKTKQALFRPHLQYRPTTLNERSVGAEEGHRRWDNLLTYFGHKKMPNVDLQNTLNTAAPAWKPAT